MNTNQSMTGSADEPNESVAASWLPQSRDDDVFATDTSVASQYAPPSVQRRFRPAMAAALLALGLSAGLAGSAWAHQAGTSPVASGLTSTSSTPSTASATGVLPASLAGGDDSDAEDGPALPALGNATTATAGPSSVGVTGTTTGVATGG
jgi:hypothetical protein